MHRSIAEKDKKWLREYHRAKKALDYNRHRQDFGQGLRADKLPDCVEFIKGQHYSEMADPDYVFRRMEDG